MIIIQLLIPVSSSNHVVAEHHMKSSKYTFKKNSVNADIKRQTWKNKHFAFFLNTTVKSGYFSECKLHISLN